KTYPRGLQSVQAGEIKRTGHTSDVSVPLPIEGNRLAGFGIGNGASATSEVCAEEDSVSIRAEPGEKRILPSRVSALKRIGHGKIGEPGEAGDIGAATGIDRNGGAVVGVSAAQIGGVNQAATIRAQLGDESVLRPVVSALHP